MSKSHQEIQDHEREREMLFIIKMFIILVNSRRKYARPRLKMNFNDTMNWRSLMGNF